MVDGGFCWASKFPLPKLVTDLVSELWVTIYLVMWMSEPLTTQQVKEAWILPPA